MGVCFVIVCLFFFFSCLGLVVQVDYRVNYEAVNLKKADWLLSVWQMVV